MRPVGRTLAEFPFAAAAPWRLGLRAGENIVAVPLFRREATGHPPLTHRFARFFRSWFRHRASNCALMANTSATASL